MQQKNDVYLLIAVILLWGCFELLALKLAGATGSEVASWMQAIGTVGAVGASLFISYRERQSSARERFEKATSLAVSLMGAIWCLEIDVSRVKHHIQLHGRAAPTPEHWDSFFQKPGSQSQICSFPLCLRCTDCLKM